MRLPLLAALLFVSVHSAAQTHPPIIDMHLHAEALADYGPSRMAMCTPFPEMPTWDQQDTFGALLGKRGSNHHVRTPCRRGKRTWPS